METKSVKTLYFSPTGTCKAIAQAVAQGIGLEPVESLDITKPEARAGRFAATKTDLLVVAAPVYGGRLPGLVEDWLNTMDLEDTPTVCLVVYGNRAYEDALLELKDIVAARGGVPVAGGAFLAEHSFSSDAAPTAVGRPDDQDQEKAQAFGAAVRDKLDAAADVGAFNELSVPGERPYKERKGPMTEVFIAVGESCTQCGLCEEICPVGAIDLDKDVLLDMTKCIRCCACIKVCPEQARTMIPSTKMMEISQWLSTNCTERKEPEWFL